MGKGLVQRLWQKHNGRHSLDSTATPQWATIPTRLSQVVAGKTHSRTKAQVKHTSNQHLNEVIRPTTNAEVNGEEAACLNSYFCGIGEQLKNEIPDTDYLSTTVESICEFEWSHRIEEEEVLNRINELNVGKSSGIPLLGSKVLKECLRHSASSFTKLLPGFV